MYTLLPTTSAPGAVSCRRRLRTLATALLLCVGFGAACPAAADFAQDIEDARALLFRSTPAALERARVLVEIAETSGAPAELIDARLLLSRALERTGDLDGSMAVGLVALEEAEALEDAARIASALRRITEVHIDRSELEEADARLERVLTIVEALGDPEQLGWTWRQLARLRRYQVRYGESLDYYTRAIEAFTQAGETLGLTDTISNRGVVLELMGQYEAAITAQTEALAYYQENDDQDGIATALFNISEVYKKLGDYENFLEYAQDALAIDLAVGDQNNISLSYGQVGRGNLLLGRIETAREFALQAVAGFEALDATDDRARALSLLAEIELADGAPQRARPLLDEALAAALELGERSAELQIRGALVDLELAEARYDAALTEAETALVIARDIGERQQEERLLGRQIEALEALDDPRGMVAALLAQRSLRESMNGDNRAQSVAWMQSQAEFLRRAQRIELLEAERALQDARLEQEGNVRLALLGGSIAAFVIFVLVYGRLGERRLNRRLAEEVEERTRELKVALRARSDFLANISHEIRTPMNAIMGFTRLALKTEARDEQRDYLEKSDRGARAMMQMLNDVLDFSKLDAGMMQRSDAPTPLQPLIRDVLDMAGARAGITDVALRTELDALLPENVIVDGIRLTQVLVNLTSNALKFTEIGEVVLRCDVVDRDGDRVQLRFEVEDTGPGIEPADQARMFAPFEQVDTSMTRRHGGTGLGLAISRQIVELLGGELTVRSRSGEGSCFGFTIPVRLAADAGVSAAPASTPGTSGSRPLEHIRLLVVDDIELNTIVASTQASLVGAEVTSVNSGQACLEAIETAAFDCVLMDLHMPEMDGLETTRRIRASSADRDLPVIAMTASVLAEERAAALEAGMDDFMPKPFEEAELIDVVLRNVERRTARTG